MSFTGTNPHKYKRSSGNLAGTAKKLTGIPEAEGSSSDSGDTFKLSKTPSPTSPTAEPISSHGVRKSSAGIPSAAPPRAATIASGYSALFVPPASAAPASTTISAAGGAGPREPARPKPATTGSFPFATSLVGGGGGGGGKPALTVDTRLAAGPAPAFD